MRESIVDMVKECGGTDIEGYIMGDLGFIVNKFEDFWHLFFIYPKRKPSQEEIDFIILNCMKPGTKMEFCSDDGCIQYMEAIDASYLN